MSKVKVRFITILSLCAAFLLTLTFGAWAALSGRIGANAEITGVEYTPTSVFSSGTGGEVGASEGSERHVQFTFNDGGNVYFRRDLAYKWFTSANADAEEEGGEETPAGTLANPGKVNYFSMEK